MSGISAVPKAMGTMLLRDGRSLAYAEWGDLHGRPVVLFHGTPGSRLTCPDEDATESLGIRLITVDRPGYGASDPQPDRSLLSFAADYAELHDFLGLPACPVVGWSGGGPYALACAVRTPALVSSVGLAASVSPIDAVPDAYSEELHRRRDVLRRDRAAGVELIVKRWRAFVDDPASEYEELLERSDVPDGPAGADSRLYARPEVREAMVAWARDAARQGSAGAVGDLVALYEPWGFSAADVSQDVAVWWGQGDGDVTRAEAAYFAETIPHATLVVYEYDGHLLPLSRWAEMLAWLH